MVGNFYSVNVGDDPKKVQLILSSLTKLSQKKADNDKTEKVPSQNNGKTEEKKSKNEASKPTKEDPNLTKVDKKNQE